MPGVRAEIVFESPESCPVATASAQTGGSLTDVSWASNGSEKVTEQVAVVAAGQRDQLEGATEVEFEEVFDYGPRQVYQFERKNGTSCICEYIEEQVGPMTDAFAREGNLHVTLHVRDVTKLRRLMSDLVDQYGNVRIEYLVEGRSGDDESELVPVDLRQLTDRQREVLSTAHEMGYFDYPRRSNAGEVAAALDIEPSTFTEHLNAAQSKLLGDLLARE